MELEEFHMNGLIISYLSERNQITVIEETVARELAFFGNFSCYRF